MAPNSNSQLDPKQREIWEKNIPYLYSWIKLNRLFYILYILIFFTAILAKRLDFPFQTVPSCFSFLLFVLFTELMNKNLKKRMTSYSRSLFVLGGIVLFWTLAFTIWNLLFRSPQPIVWILLLGLCLLSSIGSILFLYYCRDTAPLSKFLKTILGIDFLAQPILAFPLIFLDIQYCLAILPIMLIHLCQVLLLLARTKLLRK